MDAEKERLELLICDLIKQIAHSHVTVRSCEEQIRQLQQQIVILEQFVCALHEKERKPLPMI